MIRYLLLAWIVWMGVGCSLPRLTVHVASERTTLENQVLGSYNALDQEMLLVASVRGVDPMGKIRTPPPRSQEHKDAVEAMRVLAFHADDLEAFKRLGWVGENNTGLLTAFAMTKEHVPDDLQAFAARFREEEFQASVNEINAARAVVMRRVVEINEDFTQEDLPKIQRIFGSMNADSAASGERIQTADGSWTVKP